MLVGMIMISACTLPSLIQGRDANQPVFDRDAAASYSAGFEIQFSGTKNWIYLLKVRKLTALREISLHIEGLKGAQNPGDIRMVTDNATTWMTGEGTDQQCVQFSNGQGMDPTFIYPESLVSEAKLGSMLKLVGEEQLTGETVLHFNATGATSDPWRDASIDLWQEKGTGMLRQFTMTATGEDPFFGTGSGKMIAVYNAGSLESEAIDPVAGCEINVPLPEAISMYVRLPGMASFDSQSSVEDLVKYYQTTLPGQNWVEKEAPAQAQGGTVLSYQRDTEGVEIHIEQNPVGGSKVKLMFLQE